MFVSRLVLIFGVILRQFYEAVLFGKVLVCFLLFYFASARYFVTRSHVCCNKCIVKLEFALFVYCLIIVVI